MPKVKFAKDPSCVEEMTRDLTEANDGKRLLNVASIARIFGLTRLQVDTFLQEQGVRPYMPNIGSSRRYYYARDIARAMEATR